ncbi:50S ribosomal protein L24 [bacterium]|nr:50S ribosomal protein L24 [bacterium]
MFGRNKVKKKNLNKIHIKKGDTVTIRHGKYQDKGSKGKVLSVLAKEGKVIVEHINMIKKHQRPTEKFKSGGIIEREGAIPVSKVMLVCTKCNKATRVGHTKIESKRVRICKKCGEIIDKV